MWNDLRLRDRLPTLVHTSTTEDNQNHAVHPSNNNEINYHLSSLIRDNKSHLIRLEDRINNQDMASRALHQGLLKIQNDMRFLFQRVDKWLRDENQDCQIMTKNALNQVAQLSKRLQNTEYDLLEEKRNLQVVFDEIKRQEYSNGQAAFENRLTDMEQDTLHAKESFNRTIGSLRGEIHEVQTHQRNLEENISSFKNKLNSDRNHLSLEISTLNKDLFSKFNNFQKTLDTSSTSVRNDVDLRLSDLGDSVKYLQNKTSALEQQLNILQFSPTSTITGIESKMNHHEGQIKRLNITMENASKEIFSAMENERLRFSKMITTCMDEQSNKIVQAELNIRKQIQDKIDSYAETLKVQQDDIHNFENMLVNQIEKKFNTLKSYTTKTLSDYKDASQNEHRKLQTCLSSLSESISLLEKELEALKIEVSQIVRAEIMERKSCHQTVEDRIQNQEQNLTHAINTINLAINELNSKLNSTQTNRTKEIEEIDKRQWVDIQTKLLKNEQQLQELRNMMGKAVNPDSPPSKVTGLIMTNDRKKTRPRKSVNDRRIENQYPKPMQDHSNSSTATRSAMNSQAENVIDMKKKSDSSSTRRKSSDPSYRIAQKTRNEDQDKESNEVQPSKLKFHSGQNINRESPGNTPKPNIAAIKEDQRDQINQIRGLEQDETKADVQYKDQKILDKSKRTSNYEDISSIPEKESIKEDVEAQSTRKQSISSQNQNTDKNATKANLRQIRQSSNLRQFSSDDEIVENREVITSNSDSKSNLKSPNDDSTDTPKAAESDIVGVDSKNIYDSFANSDNEKSQELNNLLEPTQVDNKQVSNDNLDESKISPVSHDETNDEFNPNKLHRSSQTLSTKKDLQTRMQDNNPSPRDSVNLQQNPDIVAIMENPPLKQSTTRRKVAKNRFDTTDEDDSD